MCEINQNNYIGGGKTKQKEKNIFQLILNATLYKRVLVSMDHSFLALTVQQLEEILMCTMTSHISKCVCKGGGATTVQSCSTTDQSIRLVAMSSLLVEQSQSEASDLLGGVDAVQWLHGEFCFLLLPF